MSRLRSTLAIVLGLSLVSGSVAASPPERESDPLRPTLAERLAGVAAAPSIQALQTALVAYDRAVTVGRVAHTGLLTLIDYTRPSSEPRLWVIDLSSGRILYRELVAHGKGSGDNFAQKFSNVPGSTMTSLGLFVTDAPYIGSNGYSLRLRGLEPGLNDNAYARAIVLHGAAYVNSAIADALGRLGRSFGCPAVRAAVARPLIDEIKGGTVLFAYGGQPAPGIDRLR